MFWYPRLENIYKLMGIEEITKEELSRYYEVKTETYEKPKRTRKFYKNYTSRRMKWLS